MKKRLTVGEYVITIESGEKGYLNIVVYDSLGDVIDSMVITDDEGEEDFNPNLN
jgi:hypothetical protein